MTVTLAIEGAVDEVYTALVRVTKDSIEMIQGRREVDDEERIQHQ